MLEEQSSDSETYITYLNDLTRPMFLFLWFSDSSGTPAVKLGTRIQPTPQFHLRLWVVVDEEENLLFVIVDDADSATAIAKPDGCCKLE